MVEPSLELLQTMVQQVLDKQAEHSERVAAVERRLLSVERAVLSVRSDLVGDAQVAAILQGQIDRTAARRDRIERRLDILDAPVG